MDTGGRHTWLGSLVILNLDEEDASHLVFLFVHVQVFECACCATAKVKVVECGERGSETQQIQLGFHKSARQLASCTILRKL